MTSALPTTLPAKYYTSPEIFHAEMERFYFRRWIHAGREEQVARPGDYFLCDVAGESVIVTRDAGGALRAFYNVCRHRGTRMCTEPEGAFAGRIRCPYHSWTYGLDGTLKSAPQMDAGFSRGDYPLHRVQIDTWDGHVFLNLVPHPDGWGLNPQPEARDYGGGGLREQLGDLPRRFSAWGMGELRRHRRVVYEVKANWKLIVLNFNECLHCPVVHPVLNRLTNYLGADNEAPAPGHIGGSMGFKDGAETMSMDGVRRREYLPGLSSEQRKMVAYYAVLPNLLLSLHPDYMMTHTLWPRAVDRTEIVCEWHFQPEEMAKAEFVADDALEFWDLTNREDWRISELSQLGIQSRAYTPGPYSTREGLLAAFDRIVTEGK